MVYQWKAGSRIKGDAQIAGEVCEKLEQDGRLSAKNLLDISRPVDAPLHDNFEWNDSIAAEKYREEQARHIIHSIIIMPEKAEPVRCFFKIENTGNTYQHVHAILQNEDATAKLFNTALNELKALHKKYAAIQKLERVWDALKVCEEENGRYTA